MKLVRAKTHEPIIFRGVKQGWSDVWITYTDKPKHRTVYLGPTFIGLADLRSDIYINKKCLEDSRKGSDKTEPQYWLDEIAELEEIQLRLKSEGVVIQYHPKHPGTPDIYINKEYFDRNDVEKAIDVLMKRRGFRGARVKWKRPDGIFVHPMSIPIPE